MNWTLVAAAFLLAATIGMALSALLASMRPGWSRARRILGAAVVLPIVTIVGTLVLVIATQGHADAGMRDLATRALLALGGVFTVIAFLGGLAGAWIGRGGRR